MRMRRTKNLIVAAMCTALCVVLPMAFHMIPNAGSIFLPMHLPVLLCGFLCGWPYGLCCGFLGPVLSSLLTGMPPAASAAKCSRISRSISIIFSAERT